MELSFNDAVLARASEAFNPDTGERVPNNVLRRMSARVRYPRWKPTKVFHDWADDIERMTYSELLTRMSTFEADHPGVHKVVIGESTDSRDIVAYRIGDGSKDAICFVTGVHGNEVDGAEGMFSLFDDLLDETHPELSAITAQWDIWWVVAANPDGWENNLRNLEEVGPNGETVNLNRCFPYYWDDYVETSAESKGTAPAGTAGASPEADALYDFILDTDNKIIAVLDHHANIGQGHRYLSRNRIDCYDSSTGRDCSNYDFDIYRLQGSIRKQRGPLEVEFCQFRRSKNVPHFHSWVSSLGKFAMALESRKDEPMGPYGAVIWTYDVSLAILVTMTDALWEYRDVCLIEREATNLVNNLGSIEWRGWTTDATSISPRPNWTRTSRAITAQSDETHFGPFNGVGKNAEITNELIAEPTEDSVDWRLLGIGDRIVAVGPLPSIDDELQGFILAGENVDTGAFGGLLTPGACIRHGLVYVDATTVAKFGGWSTDGSTLYDDGYEYIAVAGTTADTVSAYTLPITLADMGYATDESRYTIFVGGSTGTVGSAFEADFSDKILLYDNTSGWSDTGKTVSARRHCAVAHQPGTDKFFIMGGEDSGGNALDDILVYDISANTITDTGWTLPVGLTRFGLAGVKSSTLYIYGGIDENGERLSEIRSFNTSTGAIATLTVFANLEDEASHEESEWNQQMSDFSVGRWLTANGGADEIYIMGGYKNLVASTADSMDIYVHDPGSNTITPARDGIYSLFSMVPGASGQITCTTGDWFSLSTFAKAVADGEICYHRAAITFMDTSGGSWSNHFGRTYYQTPHSSKFTWFRTAAPAIAGDTHVKPYLRSYLTGAGIVYDRYMFCQRSRSTSFAIGTRAAETLTFDESIRMNNFAVKFLWSPTFGFINVGEDLELARFSIDANNYISIVALWGPSFAKTYHSGNALTGPQYPAIECRKYRGAALEKTLSLVCYYGYDCRSSNIEGYDDPMEFVVEHVAGERFGFGIWRYGILGWTDDRTEVDAFTGREGSLIYNGEGYYGAPQIVTPTQDTDPIADAATREVAGLGVSETDCIHPGEPDAE